MKNLAEVVKGVKKYGFGAIKEAAAIQKTRELEKRSSTINSRKSPQIKKNLVIKRNSSINIASKLQALADKTDEYDNQMIFSYRPSDCKQFFTGQGRTERSE